MRKKNSQSQEDKLLTDLELKVMNVLWELENAFVKEIVAEWKEEPLPAYNTVSTIIRIMEEKGFVGHEAFGRSHRYFPVLSREEYQKRLVRNVLDNVFSGSLTNLVSAAVEPGELSSEEIEALRKMIEESE